MQPNFHLQTLITKRWLYLNENWSRFEKDIENRPPRGLKIDRRKLKDLSQGDERVTLNIVELRVLYEYFIEVGLTQPHENFIFRAPGSLLDALHGEKEITVFYPSRYLWRFDMEGASRWDIRAFEELHRTREIAGLHVEIQDAFHEGNRYPSVDELKKNISLEPWYEMLKKDQAIVSIGCPMSSYASEETLCRMFDIDPYNPQGLDTEDRLPFYFYWPELPKDTRFSTSSLSVTREELRAFYPNQLKELPAKTRAVLVGNKLYPAPKAGESMNLVIAQYRNGHLNLVLLGVYAPGTLAIAECVAERLITTTLGPYRHRNEQQPILINLISTMITKTDNSDGTDEKPSRDTRTLVAKRLVSWQRWQRTAVGFELLEEGDY